MPPTTASKLYVDTAVERVYAKYAGLGWPGKITPAQRAGSWLLLGEIILTIPWYMTVQGSTIVVPASAAWRRPTQALLEPYVLDAARCLSDDRTQGSIPEEFGAQTGHHIFGCDICQDVCPWNRKRHFTDADLQPFLPGAPPGSSRT